MDKRFSVANTIVGTSFWGYYIYCSVNTLKKIFGEPYYHEPSIYKKTQNEWRLVYKNIVFAIYDYKVDDLYNDDEIIEWHIGTYDENSSEKVTEVINEILDKLAEDGED